MKNRTGIWSIVRVGGGVGDKDQYDVVLVRSFGDIHWRTSKFCKIRHLVQKGIYSMHDEIYLPYEMEGKNNV